MDWGSLAYSHNITKTASMIPCFSEDTFKFCHLHQCCPDCVHLRIHFVVAHEATSELRVYACRLLWCYKLASACICINLEGWTITDSNTLRQVKGEGAHCSSIPVWIWSSQPQQIPQCWRLGSRGSSLLEIWSRYLLGSQVRSPSPSTNQELFNRTNRHNAGRSQ